jgi:hypothetical protein
MTNHSGLILIIIFIFLLENISAQRVVKFIDYNDNKNQFTINNSSVLKFYNSTLSFNNHFDVNYSQNITKIKSLTFGKIDTNSKVLKSEKTHLNFMIESDILHIKDLPKEDNNYILRIYSQNGSQVIINQQKCDGELNINISNLCKGVYLCIVNSNTSTNKFKFLIY